MQVIFFGSSFRFLTKVWRCFGIFVSGQWTVSICELLLVFDFVLWLCFKFFPKFTFNDKHLEPNISGQVASLWWVVRKYGNAMQCIKFYHVVDLWWIRYFSIHCHTELNRSGLADRWIDSLGRRHSPITSPTLASLASSASSSSVVSSSFTGQLL